MPKFGMRKVDSSNIDQVGYDEESEKLRVLFNSGDLWEYDAVPAYIHLNLVGASSIGKFFNARVRGIYSGRKVN